MLELKKKILKEKLKSIISFNVSIKEYSTIKIGGNVFALCAPKTEKELKLCVKTFKENGVDFRLIGNGSNILFSNNLSKLAIITTKYMTGVKVCLKNQTIHAFAGEKLNSCFKSAQQVGLSGFENLAFIPATVGGAIVANAGAFGCEIKDILESVRVLLPSGKIKTLKCNELGFSYRNSNIKSRNAIIVSAVFKLRLLAPSVIMHIANQYLILRRETQPVGLSLGSVFKKVNNVSAGKYIDDADLKNTKIGGCIISEKHANFILNIGGAKPSDYKRLVSLIKKEVWKKFKVNLETEVEYI